jgi:hypothetical protein
MLGNKFHSTVSPTQSIYKLDLLFALILPFAVDRPHKINSKMLALNRILKLSCEDSFQTLWLQFRVRYGALQQYYVSF